MRDKREYEQREPGERRERKSWKQEGEAWVLVLCGRPEPSLAQKRPLAQPGGGQGQDRAKICAGLVALAWDTSYH